MSKLKKKKKTGRPKGSGLAITPEKKKEILAILAMGCSRNDAADYCVVGRSTLSATIGRDEEFAEQIIKYEAEGKMRHIKKISKEKQWQASAWMLERKYPKEFGRQPIVQVEKTVVSVTQEPLSKEEVDMFNAKFKENY